MPAPDKNRRTEYRCNADGHLVELIAFNAATGNQVTRWEHARPAGNGVASTSLVRAKTYPDMNTTASANSPPSPINASATLTACFGTERRTRGDRVQRDAAI